ncbi:MAG: DUF305 domain-containing protein, partial [Actinobacteria bacterium]|nr:DUF305 domain-containing protein [Actinomycetota bacterium]
MCHARMEHPRPGHRRSSRVSRPGPGIRRLVGVTFIALAVSLVAPACGSTSATTGGDSSGGNTATIPAEVRFNSADLEFVQGMLPHHQQAITMADHAIAKSSYL